MPFLEHEIEKKRTYSSEPQMGQFSYDILNFAKQDKSRNTFFKTPTNLSRSGIWNVK